MQKIDLRSFNVFFRGRMQMGILASQLQALQTSADSYEPRNAPVSAILTYPTSHRQKICINKSLKEILRNPQYNAAA